MSYGLERSLSWWPCHESGNRHIHVHTFISLRWCYGTLSPGDVPQPSWVGEVPYCSNAQSVWVTEKPRAPVKVVFPGQPGERELLGCESFSTAGITLAKTNKQTNTPKGILGRRYSMELAWSGKLWVMGLGTFKFLTLKEVKMMQGEVLGDHKWWLEIK